MDGFNKRLSESVQLRLSVALSLTIVLVAVAASAFVFVSALDEAHKLQDDTLRQVAMLYDRQHMTLHYPEGPALKGDDEESRVIIQHLTDSSQALANGDETLPLPLPATLVDGLATVDVGGEAFRILVRSTSRGERIAVAQELRSPMTALPLQAERLAVCYLQVSARERLLSLCQGIERSRQLIDQLLSLAAAQAAVPRPQARIGVHAVYRRVLEDLLPLAEQKHLDIGVEDSADVQLLINPMDLFTLIKNLVDNATRYTPAGGTIDLCLAQTDTCVCLQVKDSGPGISVEEHDRVFDPFYRTLGSGETGSGLGLSIVRAIAERVGARVALGFTDETSRRGLCVSLWSPAPGAKAGVCFAPFPTTTAAGLMSTPLLSSWIFWALLSAVFAAMTAIFGKIGITGINSDFATLLRTVVVLVSLALILYATRQYQSLSSISARSYLFLVLSGLATGASWICYYRALQLGQASLVAPVDKLSVVIVAVLGVTFLGEKLDIRQWVGIGLITVGVVVLAWRR